VTLVGDGGRRPKILVSDATPLSLLGTISGALDWLFVPGCEIWLPDIIIDEVGEGHDQCIRHRAEIAGWIERNRDRIKRLTTRIGAKYRREMSQYEQASRLWEMAGRPVGLEPEKPDWRDRGDESVWIAVRLANSAIDTLGECIIVLADDGEIRDAIQVRGRRQPRASISLMGTQTFIAWLAQDFGVKAAESAWMTIEAAREKKVPDQDEFGPDDPIFIRVP
jgi:hypothetical protein